MLTSFRRVLLDKENRCEACSVADFNRDGTLQILCGEYLYYGKGFSQKRKVCSLTYDGNYVYDFSDYPLDVNGDGYPDVVTGSWWDNGLYWRENPHNTSDEWVTHKVCDLTNIETIRYFDIDNCGIAEVFPNTPNEPQSFFKLVDGTFKQYRISSGNSGHGMGFGDINGDGFIDVLLWNGWLENPGDPFAGEWKFHPAWEIPMASVPMLVHDINGDGLNDVIAGAGHNFGLWWLEQRPDGSFVKHEIDAANSQYHDMQLADVDLDGQLELVTGARHFAHNGNDPGEHNPIGLYVYDINGGNFVKNTLNFGPAETTSGTGIYMWITDLTGNGKPDIVAPGKEGLYIFYNE